MGFGVQGSGFRVFGFLGFWVFGILGFWVFGFLGFRVLGFQGFRVLGFSSSRVWIFQGLGLGFLTFAKVNGSREGRPQNWPFFIVG